MFPTRMGKDGKLVSKGNKILVDLIYRRITIVPSWLWLRIFYASFLLPVLHDMLRMEASSLQEWQVQFWSCLCSSRHLGTPGLRVSRGYGIQPYHTLALQPAMGCKVLRKQLSCCHCFFFLAACTSDVIFYATHIYISTIYVGSLKYGPRQQTGEQQQTSLDLRLATSAEKPSSSHYAIGACVPFTLTRRQNGMTHP